MPLQIESRFCGHVAIIECRGRIVADELPALESVLQNEIREFHNIVLNVGEVTRLDSMGMGLLVRYSSNLRKRSGDIRLAATPPLIAEVLDITLLSVSYTHLDVYKRQPLGTARLPMVRSASVCSAVAELAPARQTG